MKNKTQESIHVKRMQANKRRAYGWPEMIYFQLGYLACLRHNKMITKEEEKQIKPMVDLKG